MGAPSMADALMLGTIGVATANILLAALLTVLYVRVYDRTKAPFTLGLILFALAFLAQNVLVVYSYSTMMPYLSSALEPYLLGIGILEAIGLASVVYTATR